jgi:long-chain acyl-CoA synthetase
LHTDNIERPWLNNYPTHVPHEIEVRSLHLGQLLRETARKYPDSKSIVFLDSIMSYRQLDENVDRLAAALHDLGLKKGDVLAMMLPNSHQFVIGFFACQRLGLTVTAINPTYRPMEIQHHLNDSGAKALIVLDAVYEQVEPVIEQTGVEHLIGTNIVDLCGFSALKIWLGRLLKKIPHAQMPQRTIPFMKLLESEPNPPEITIDPDRDIVCLQYTGGTTGTPKGAMLTSRNLMSNLDQGLAWVGHVDSGTGFVGVLPLFHVFALTCCMNFAVANGGFMLLFPRPPADMRELAAGLEKWSKDCDLIMAGVPALFNKINQTEGLERYNLSRLTKSLSGAGPLPHKVQTDFEAKTKSQVVEGYGLSETSPIVTANPFDLEPGVERVPGSIGLPLPSTDCRIVDLEERDKVLGFGPDQVGELCVRGPQVMQGYYNQPEETAHVIRDGWFHTGDIAYMDENGWIYIKDRARDLVKHHGYSVFPQEVEDYLFNHPAVSDAAVVGIPQTDGDELLKAYLVLKQGAEQTSQEDIIAWSKENMGHYKVPDQVEFREELPKTQVGKVLRRVLRDEELAQTQAED